MPCAAPELALVPGAVVVESQDARAVRATLVVHLTVVSAGEVLVDEGFDRYVVSPGRGGRGRLALHPKQGKVARPSVLGGGCYFRGGWEAAGGES